MTRGDVPRPHPKPTHTQPCAHSISSYTMPRRCQRLQAGTKTTYTLKHHHVYVLTNTTAWVEAHWGDHIHRTPNHTLYFDEAGKRPRGWAGCQCRCPRAHLILAVKPDPPSTGMPFTKTSSRLQLRVPRPLCHSGSRPPQREARFRKIGAHGWTQVKPCLPEPVETDGTIRALRQFRQPRERGGLVTPLLSPPRNLAMSHLFHCVISSSPFSRPQDPAAVTGSGCDPWGITQQNPRLYQ